MANKYTIIINSYVFFGIKYNDVQSKIMLNPLL